MRVEFPRIPLRSVNLALSFSLPLLRPLPCTFASSSPSLSVFGLSLFVCLLRARRRRRQAVWLVLGSPSRYYHIRYKNRRQSERTIAVHSTGKERSLRRRVVSPWTTSSRLVLLACSILAINFFFLLLSVSVSL